MDHATRYTLRRNTASIKRFDFLFDSFAGQFPHDPAQDFALRIFRGAGKLQ